MSGQGTVYNYVRGKEEPFVEVLIEAGRRVVEGAAQVATGGSVRDGLRALATADVAILRGHEGIAKVAVREAMSLRPRSYPLIVEYLGPNVQGVGQLLLSGRERGEIRNDLALPEFALPFVGLVTLRYVQQWGPAGSWPDLDRIPNLGVRLFLDGAAGASPHSGEADEP